VSLASTLNVVTLHIDLRMSLNVPKPKRAGVSE
jgi:hypothetical protein